MKPPKNKSLRTLMWLNPDPGHIEDLTAYVYNLHALNKAKLKRKQIQGVISGLRKMGWDITTCPNNLAGLGYTLSTQHWHLVQVAAGYSAFLTWSNAIPLTPGSVSQFIIRQK